MQAYDIEMLHQEPERRGPHNHGWCFGLPPGITPQQWPLDPVTGYPLVHGFTLLLPQDYRVHGAECVALSFFATAADQNDGGASSDEALVAAVLAESDAPPTDADLLPFWQHGRQRHPRLSRMTDILGYAYASILLTQQEFNGPLCQPPRLPAGRFAQHYPQPEWLGKGAAAAYWAGVAPGSVGPLENHWIYRKFGAIPESRLDYARALRWTSRASDPNAGKAPREGRDAQATGYQLPYFWRDGKITRENYCEHEWVKGHQQDHIGGTMRPVQGIPEFSPYYVEFEEYFGGYNFGGGNAQFDFKDMKFDWACG